MKEKQNNTKPLLDNEFNEKTFNDSMFSLQNRLNKFELYIQEVKKGLEKSNLGILESQIKEQRLDLLITI